MAFSSATIPAENQSRSVGFASNGDAIIEELNNGGPSTSSKPQSTATTTTTIASQSLNSNHESHQESESSESEDEEESDKEESEDEELEDPIPCMVCKKDMASYAPLECRHETLCKKCAMKQATGGKCKACGIKFFQLKRTREC